MVSLIRFIRGFVRVLIISDYAERFLNFCSKKKVSIWKIERDKHGIAFNLSIEDYLKFREYRKESGLDFKVKLLRKIGFPLWFRRASKRTGLCVGLIIFIMINVFLSMFIWQIDVKCNTDIDKNEVLRVCDELGIELGIASSSIDTYNHPQEIALRLDSAAWVSLNVEGSKLTINISEAKSHEDSEKKPCNIVSSADAVIKSSEVRIGKNLTTIGKAVRKGDLLVSGIDENSEKTHFVSSDADILGETHRRFTVSVEKEFSLKKLKGNYEHKRLLSFFGFEIPLYLSGVEDGFKSVGNYEEFIDFGGVKIPVGVRGKYFSETEIETITVDKALAENIAMGQVYEEIRKLPIEKIAEYDVRIHEEAETFEVIIEVVAIENICSYREIVLGD